MGSLSYVASGVFSPALDAREEYVIKAVEDTRRECSKDIWGSHIPCSKRTKKVDISTERSKEKCLPRHAERELIISRAWLGEAYRATRCATRPPDGVDRRPMDAVWADVRDCGGAADHLEVVI